MIILDGCNDAACSEGFDRVKKIEEAISKAKQDLTWSFPCLSVRIENGKPVIANEAKIRAAAMTTVERLNELIALLEPEKQ